MNILLEKILNKNEQIKFFIFISLYTIAFYISLSFYVPDSGFSAIWLPSGVLLGFLVISKTSLRGFYLLLAIVLGLSIQIIHLSFDPIFSFLMVIVNMSEAIIAAIITKRYCGGEQGFSNFKQVVVFLVIITILIHLISAVFPAVYVNSVSNYQFFNAYIAWVCSAGMGILFVAPWIISLHYDLKGKILSLLSLEYIVIFTLSIILASFTFSKFYTLEYQSFPLFLLILVLMWSAVRFKVHGFTTMNLTWVLIAAYGSTSGFGPFTLEYNLTLSGILGFQIFSLFVAGIALFAFVESHKIQILSNKANQASEKNEQLTKELEEKKKFVLEQSKLAVMGEMIGHIAHQWKQPLSTLSMIGNNLQADIELNEVNNDKLSDASKNINKQVKYLSNTIDTFSDFLKPNGEISKVQVESIIHSSLEIVKKSLENNNINIIEEFTQTSSVYVKSSELMQVIINLINNSKDAFKINNIQERKISIRTYENKNSIIIQIEDTAGGIEVDKKAKIFEPYFTTKSKSGGTGLGLYIVKTIIVEHCNGTIEVHNTNKGACFSIAIPLEVERGIK